MWKWTWRSAMYVSKNIGRIHPWNAQMHPDRTYVCTCNRQIGQFWKFIFKLIVAFKMSRVCSISPHLFGSLCMLLDLYQHTAQYTMKHMFVGASRACDASKQASSPLEDSSLSSHLFHSEQHPSKQLIFSFFYFTHGRRLKAVLTLMSLLTLHWTSSNLSCCRFVPVEQGNSAGQLFLLMVSS